MLAAYWPVLHQSFVDFDDPTYVQQNRHLLSGSTWETFQWAFTTYYAANWHPLTWISHLVDVRWYGLSPGGHHLTSLLLHLANTLLLFLVLRAYTGTLRRSVLVAAIFALHPLRVESVAWISERKDVLAAFFWMASLGAYLRYVRRPGALRLTLVVVLFALGLMSKPMVVTLPFVLLLLDWWPLGRFDRGVGRLVAEKAPLFILTALSMVVTFLAQRAGGMVRGLHIMHPGLRFSNALVSYVAYLRDLVFPSGLAVFYPHPLGALPAWKTAAAVLLLLTLTALAVRRRSRQPYLAVGWLWYLGTLVPAIGIIQVGEQARADRYTYLPLVGVTLALVWGAAELAAGRLSRKRGLVAATVLALGALAVATRAQVDLWRNDAVLFSHGLKVTRDNWMMHNNLGNALYREARLEEAMDHYREAIRVRPDYPEALYSLASILTQQGRNVEAEIYLRRALDLWPTFTAAWYNLGWVLFQQRRETEALAAFQEAVREDPGHAGAWTYIGMLLEGRGDNAGAASAYREILSLEPDNYRARAGLERLGWGGRMPPSPSKN